MGSEVFLSEQTKWDTERVGEGGGINVYLSGSF